MSFLSHHGIKGQQWGVRHGPPYPIEDRVLRKGHRINSVSGIKKTKDYINKGSALYAYNSSDQWDSNVYKGAFSKYLRRYRNVPVVYDHEFVVVKDLKMPTKKERVDEFLNIVKTNKNTLKEMTNTAATLAYYNVGGEKQAKEYQDFADGKLKSDKDIRTVGYKVFNHMMEAYSRYDSTTQYMQTMASKYDAMVDDNNQGVYNDAHDPVIIFRAKEAIAPYAKMKVGNKVKDKEINKRSDIVRDEMRKQGKSMLL
jgi:hypothetical protein